MAQIEKALRDLQQGKMVIVTDDANRENEADVIMAADYTTPAALNFMMTEARGLICVSIPKERANELHLPPMTAHNDSQFQTNFTVSIDAATGIGSGIQASDRNRTIEMLLNPKARQNDFRRPGHIFPLVSHPLGVLGRPGHTEAALDLVRLAGLRPMAVLSEIVDKNGQSARGAALARFARRHRLTVLSVADLQEYRLRHEKLVARITTTKLPTAYGVFTTHLYTDLLTQEAHIALILGQIRPATKIVARVHSACITGETFYSERCDCRKQLDLALQTIAHQKNGIIIYLGQEGRGIGLANKLRAYALQDRGLDTVEANQRLGFLPDERQFFAAAHILKDLGAHTIRLLTNNPRKVSELREYGLNVSRQALTIEENRYNKKYLETKRKKLGHW